MLARLNIFFLQYVWEIFFFTEENSQAGTKTHQSYMKSSVVCLRRAIHSLLFHIFWE